MAIGKLAVPRRGSKKLYAILTVPHDVRPFMKTKAPVLWKSTGTTDQRAADRIAEPIIAGWLAEFDKLRRQHIPTEYDIQAGAHQHYLHQIARDDDNRRTMPKIADYKKARAEYHRAKDAGEIDPEDEIVYLAENVLPSFNPLEWDRLFRSWRQRDLANEAATGEITLIKPIADAFIQRENLDVAEGSPEYFAICHRLQRAELEALTRASERDAAIFGRPIIDEGVKAPDPSLKVERPKPGEAIMDLFAIFKREKLADKSADTWDMNEKIVRLFVSFIGDRSPVTAVTRKAIRDWKVALDGWPIKAADVKEFDGLSFKQIIRKNQTLASPKPGISDRTKNKYISAMGSFCRWLLVNEYIPNDVITGMAVSEDTNARRRHSFDAGQLSLIFGSPLFSACAADHKEHLPGKVRIRDWRYWIPVIALYTGARLGEMCQLLTHDVRQIGNVWVMHITEEGGDGKRVKTDGSQRVVPLHPTLIALGLPTLVEARKAAKEPRLFPELQRNVRGQFGMPSRFYRSFLARVGAKTDKSVTFHSLRHGFTDALRRAGFRNNEFDVLLGHTGATMTARYGNLREGELSVLKKMIDAIDFGSVAIGSISAIRSSTVTM